MSISSHRSWTPGEGGLVPWMRLHRVLGISAGNRALERQKDHYQLVSTVASLATRIELDSPILRSIEDHPVVSRFSTSSVKPASHERRNSGSWPGAGDRQAVAVACTLCGRPITLADQNSYAAVAVALTKAVILSTQIIIVTAVSLSPFSVSPSHFSIACGRKCNMYSCSAVSMVQFEWNAFLDVSRVYTRCVEEPSCQRLRHRSI